MGVAVVPSCLVERADHGGWEATAFEAFESAESQPPDDGGFLASTEPETRAPAVDHRRAKNGPRWRCRGYPPDNTNELIDTLAAIYSVERASVIVGTGSGPDSRRRGARLLRR